MRKTFGRACLAALLCALWALALAPPALAESLAQRLERFRSETGTPGVALAILRQGAAAPEVHVSGLADVEQNTRLAPDAAFRIGSVTKLFTAALVLGLVDEGRLSLDETMAAHFPQLPSAGRITVRMLLQHTSGLRDFLDIPAFQASMARPWSQKELLELVAREPLEFPPGRRLSYSNSGYLVLGLLAEQVTGRPYAELLRQRVTVPLGMAATRLADDRELTPRRAHGYDLAADNGAPRLVNPALMSMAPPGFSGGLLSTPADFVRLAELCRVLKPATWRAMREPAAPKEGGELVQARPGLPKVFKGYGLGFELLRLEGDRAPMLLKGGLIPGFASWFLLVPEKGLAIAVSANCETAQLPLLLLVRELSAREPDSAKSGGAESGARLDCSP